MKTVVKPVPLSEWLKENGVTFDKHILAAMLAAADSMGVGSESVKGSLRGMAGEMENKTTDTNKTKKYKYVGSRDYADRSAELGRDKGFEKRYGIEMEMDLRDAPAQDLEFLVRQSDAELKFAQFMLFMKKCYEGPEPWKFEAYTESLENYITIMQDEIVRLNEKDEGLKEFIAGLDKGEV